MAASREFKPTPAQKNAIEAHGGSITVSAAAGSGKTRVLVQRVIRHLTEECIPADRLLILTFTNTAAEEMRSRIAAAIDALIAAEPRNEFYRRQQLLLGSADICTIDSYCSKMVKENFFRLGIRRDYRIGSETELYELRRRIMSELIEQFYTPPDKESEDGEALETARARFEAFDILSMLLTDPKLDSDLENELLRAYDTYSAHAFPEEWMEACLKKYAPGNRLSDSEEAVYLMREPASMVRMLRTLFDKAAEYRYVMGERLEKTKKNMYKSIMDAFDSYEYFLEGMEELYSEEQLNMDEAARLISGFEKVTIRYGAAKDMELKYAAGLLNAFADIVREHFMAYADFTEEEYSRSNALCMPVISCLREILETFDKQFFAAKTEKGMLDFHDLERLMLQLLYEKDESGSYVLTPYAAELSQCYEEIMIDEYQDTNDIQEHIFKAISRRETNLFVVGDIKQSIYRFRDAEPTLFKKRCAEAVMYDPEHPSFPALIVLDQNFRSRSGIIDSVNYVFGLLMSEQAGEIAYDRTQRLTTGAEYPERGDGVPDTEVHCVQYDRNSPEDEDDASIDNANRAEAIYCAGLIRRMVEDGTMVTENGVLRKAEYSDFCILLRAVRNKAYIYAEELEQTGIPACTDTDFDLLQRYEIRAAIAFLKILNNPLSDIDIAASLLNPVFGFTPDELAQLKEERGKRYYKKLLSRAKEADAFGKKCSSFLETVQYFRTFAMTKGCDRLLTEFYDRTGFACAVSAMQGGEQRVQNLRRLVNFAADYEANTGGGLTGFVRHIRYLEEAGSGIQVSGDVPANAVRIMTIHHSKGLEFPICILAGTNTAKPGLSKRINFHPRLGIGLRAVDMESGFQYNTLQYTAIQAANQNEEKSEQMRVLYVAMTRAKEKLIVLSTMGVKRSGDIILYDDPQYHIEADESYVHKLEKIAEHCALNEQRVFEPYEVMACRNYSEWLLMCLMVSDRLQVLRSLAAQNGEEMETVSAPEIAFRYVNHVRTDHAETEEEQPVPCSQTLLSELQQRFAAADQVDVSTMVPSKVSASMLAHRGIASEFVAASKPSFTRKGGISPTERGTATHEFLQYADFERLYEALQTDGNFDKERQRVTDTGYMTREQTEIIDMSSIEAFVRSPLFQRALHCLRVYKEYRFTVQIPAEMTLPDADASAYREVLRKDGVMSVLQGAIDCMLEEEDGLVIIDYKTDRVKEAAVLSETYGTQLRLYKEAAQRLFAKPVKACYIYALHCKQMIEVI